MSTSAVVLICACIMLAPHTSRAHANWLTWLLLIGSIVKEVLL